MDAAGQMRGTVPGFRLRPRPLQVPLLVPIAWMTPLLVAFVALPKPCEAQSGGHTRTAKAGIRSPLAANPTGQQAAKSPRQRAIAAYDDAVNAFKYQDFDKAITQLRKLLYPTSRLDRQREWPAREYLGAALWWHDKRQAALDEFTALLVRNPQAELDPTFYPPQMVKDFEQLRSNLIRLGVIRGEQKPAPVKSLQLRRRPHAALSFVPFGVGQIANDEVGKGLSFMVAEALLASASFAFFEANRRDAILHVENSGNRAWQVSTGVAFWLVSGWGIVDAISKHRELARLEKVLSTQ